MGYRSEMQQHVKPSKSDWDLLNQIFSLEYELIDNNSDQSKLDKLKRPIDQIDSLKLTNLCEQLINNLALKRIQQIRDTGKHQQIATQQQQQQITNIQSPSQSSTPSSTLSSSTSLHSSNNYIVRASPSK
ncbi:hypothetical protein PPL_04738 [Heterostelium album PN500]|uniref:Uncharacterized protein n=1 Tax=Heterostelium pallidum (strain ATCC 26659 / Pp 5 / PN500) TaxID=670386 RepID=D3B8E5_HETP5|nr:hypothetical protein PPL_04738 [Heterostelium album PN500]EFA82313.1 hypothetical protein PPL_04738 [Heterostelium album PN500]|eukprot:XP_020434430.1 hypothetical protein PPL_04738 [Heterostelium album PN500]